MHYNYSRTGKRKLRNSVEFESIKRSTFKDLSLGHPLKRQPLLYRVIVYYNSLGTVFSGCADLELEAASISSIWGRIPSPLFSLGCHRSYLSCCCSDPPRVLSIHLIAGLWRGRQSSRVVRAYFLDISVGLS